MEGGSNVRLGHGSVVDRVALDGVEIRIQRDRRRTDIAAARRGFRRAGIAGVSEPEAHIQVAGAAVRDLQQALAHGDGRNVIDHQRRQLERFGQYCQRDGAVLVGGLHQQPEQLRDLQAGIGNRARQHVPWRQRQRPMFGMGTSAGRDGLEEPRCVTCVVMLVHCCPLYAGQCLLSGTCLRQV
ncbi:hypothetical protein D9M68_310380 [compost metagenome]